MTHDRQHHVLQAQWAADAALGATGSGPTSTPTPTATATATASPSATVTATVTATATAVPGTPPATLATATPGPKAAMAGAGSRAAAGGVALPGLPLAFAALSAAQQTPLTTFTFDSYPPVAKFGSPDPLSVDLNSGSLTEGIQLDVPPGPAGAMPNITLAYNSGAVSEQHSPQGAAGWVGEGWSLSLGAISWAEHNVQPTCTTCGNLFQDTWELTDPFGTSTELIPPNLAAATYYDDSNNWWCTTGNAAADTCPIQFRTARDSYAKVYAYVGPTKLGASADPLACFRVYLTNGVMEEFGCTPDSLQYYPIQAGSVPGQTNKDVYYPVNWLPDLITNPQGDQVHITYQSDTATAADGLTYPRDTVLSTIEWDAPDCVSARQRCDSSSWHPHYRVQFSATHQQVQIARTTTTGTCNSDTSVRCDDPAAVSGGVAVPLVNGTFVLNDAYVQTNPSGNGSGYSGTTWNTVRDYQLSYEQSAPTTVTDPATGKSISTAGYLDLTKLQEVGDDGTTAYPATSFSYTNQTQSTQYYEDGSFTPYLTTFCGPSWNTGGNGGTCDLWSQSYAGNSRYLSSVSNGQGLQQTISWANARSNTHGANSGGSPANPLACNDANGNPIGGYPCNSADDQAWSRMVVSQRSDIVVQLTQAGQGGVQTNTPVTSTTAYTYQLSYPLVAQECFDCKAGMYWGNQNDGDYLDYYMGHFMGFAQTSVSNPDGSVAVHKFEATEGWGIFDTSKGISCAGASLPPIQTTCQLAPWWHVANAGHGLETEADYYDTNGTTLLKKVTAQYQPVCPPSGVTASPSYTVGTMTFGPWGNNLVSELDHNNPVADCDVQQTQQVTTTSDGSTTNSVTDTEAFTYDSYGRKTQTTSTSSSGGGSPTTIYHKTSYVWNDGLTLPPAQRTTADQSPSSANNYWTGVYLIDLTALQTTEDSSGSGTRSSCRYTGYDGLAATSTGQNGSLTAGNVTEEDTYTSCGTAPSYTPSGKVGTTTSYDSYGNATGTKDPDATNGDSTHTGASGTACAGNTSCAQYDPTSQAKSTLGANLANQTRTARYGIGPVDPTSGYGLWPTATTDANGQTTTSTYDALGRLTSKRAPGQSTGPATESLVYVNWCTGTGAQSPCVETDTTKRLDSGTTVTTRQFYDGAGRLVETRTPAPGNQDVIQYTLYNVAGEAVTASVRYFVTAYTGAAGSAAYSIPDSSQAVTTTTYDGLHRTLQATDALSNVTQAAYSVVCSAPGTGSDTGCYEQTLGIDANHHQHGALGDGFGRQIYDQRYNGNSGATYTLYSTAKNTYDYNGHLTQVLHSTGSTYTTSYTYDAAGRLTTLSDPDRGSETYSYDANGNRTQTTDARGTSGTTYTGYDALNRPIWRNTSAGGSGAYVTYSYDGTANGSYGAGRLAAEVFRSGSGTGGTSFSGAYTSTYDALGRTTRTDQTMGGAGGCPATGSGWTCADIGSPALAGSQSYAGDGLWTVSGEGADIWGTSDQFHYLSQSQAGDATLSLHLDAQTPSDPWAKAGPMVRASNAANAAYYALEATPGNGIVVQYRDSTGGSAATLATITGAASQPPVWLAVARSGTTYTAYTSHDGTNWTLVPSSSRTMSGLSGSVLVGAAVDSRTTGAVSIATIDSVSVTTGGTGACPSSWTCQDIGGPTPAGTQNALGNGVWTVAGSGADIWGSSDQFHYVSQAQAGDVTLTTHVDAQTNTNAWAKAGVMVRGSTAANAPFYDLVVTPGNNISVQYRDTAGGAAAILATVTGTAPVYLAVARSGTTYTAYTSTDGVSWTFVAGSSRTMSNLSGTVQVGLAVTSHSAGVLSTATFDQLSTTTGAASALGCPNTWTCQDIGSPALAGAQGYFGNGIWAAAGAGSDIWGTSDQFHFVSLAQTGDGSVTAHVKAQSNTSNYAKAGVMLRDGTAANAAHYFLQVEPSGQYFVTYRATAGGSTASLVSGNVALPVYLQVTRSGSTFSASLSFDGVTWTTIPGSAKSLTLSSTLQAGVAVTSQNTSAVSSAIVDQVSPSALPSGTVSTTTPATPVTVTVTVTALAAPTGVTSYPIQQAYNDASLPTTTIYPDGENISTSYTGQGWLAGLTTTQSGTTTTLLGAPSYSGAGGAAQQLTGAQLGNNTYQFAATYDTLVRPTDTKLTRTSSGAVLFEQTRGYDAVGNVSSVGTTLPQGTDNQAFCFDEQNRLTWASSASGSVPCGGTLTAGSLAGGAVYQQL